MESVLNRQAMQFIQMVDDLALKRLTKRYSFMAVNEYVDLLRSDVSEGMRVYWSETLERAHLASVTAVLRSRHWLSAVLSAQSDMNALAFAAAFRGLMESAADTTTAPITNSAEAGQSLPNNSGCPFGVGYYRCHILRTRRRTDSLLSRTTHREV